MVFNEQELLKYTEGDSSLSAALLQMAVSDMPDFLEKAQEERKMNDLVSTAEFLHKVKGIAGCIGAVQIHSLCTDMESDIKAVQSFVFFDEQIDNLGDAVSDFIQDQSVQKYMM